MYHHVIRERDWDATHCGLSLFHDPIGDGMDCLYTYRGVTGFDKGMGEVEGKSKRNSQSLGYGTNTKSTSYSVYLMVCEKYFPRTYFFLAWRDSEIQKKYGRTVTFPHPPQSAV